MFHLCSRSLAIGSTILGFGVRARSARTQTLVGGFFAVNVLSACSPSRPTRPAAVDRPRSVRTFSNVLSPIVFQDISVRRWLAFIDMLVPPAIRVHSVHARFFASVSTAMLSRDFQHTVLVAYIYRVLYIQIRTCLFDVFQDNINKIVV